MLEDYVAKHLDILPIEIKLISRFHIKNQVYKISALKGDFLMKAYLDEDRYINSENECYATKKLSVLSDVVEMPIVIDDSEEFFKGPVLFRAFVEGQELKEQIKQTVIEKGDYLYWIDEAIREISKIHELYKGDVKDYSVYCKNKFNKLFKTDDLQLKEKLNNHPAINEYLKQRSSIEPSLITICNGDLGGHEIIIKGDKIVSIIDWETYCYNDPAQDIGYLTYSILSSFHKDKFIVKGMLDHVITNHGSKNLKFFIAERAIGTSVIDYINNNKEKVSWAMELAEELLKDR